MPKIPIPKRLNISSIKELRGFFEFYKKELEKNPEYGKKRAERERKAKEYHIKKNQK
jgi:hypothetical protein